MLNSYTLFVIFYAFTVSWALILNNRKSRFFVYVKAVPVFLCSIFLVSFLFKTETHLSHIKHLVPMALLSGCTGDYLIARFEDFRYGMTLFFAGHCVYIIFFLGIAETNYDPRSLFVILPTETYMPLLITKLPAKYKKLRFLITAYSVTLAIMVLAAVNVSVATGDLRFAVGGMLFLLSDIILSQEILLRKESRASLLVLPLYYNAQLLLTLAAAGTL